MSLSPRLIGVLAVALGILDANAEGTQSFATWFSELRAEARTRGISSATLDRALSGLTYEPRVVQLQQRQPEVRQTFAKYISTRVTEGRLERARRELASNRSLLEKVASRYHVQPRFIVALWAVESDFGRDTGSWSTIQSLASLAYGGRRRDYFRRELIAALLLLERMPERIGITGSWAGAVGQCQFMPSNVRRLGADFDGDGRVDVWDSLPDIFASIANFLAKSGWHDDQTWGREVRAPAAFDWRLSGHDVRLHLPVWTRLGLRRADGGPLPMRPLWTSLVAPDGPNGRIFLVYENFRVLRKWNRSDHFALSVGLLTEGMR